jgi:hypothetical protein
MDWSSLVSEQRVERVDDPIPVQRLPDDLSEYASEGAT